MLVSDKSRTIESAGLLRFLAVIEFRCTEPGDRGDILHGRRRRYVEISLLADILVFASLGSCLSWIDQPHSI